MALEYIKKICKWNKGYNNRYINTVEKTRYQKKNDAGLTVCEPAWPNTKARKIK